MELLFKKFAPIFWINISIVMYLNGIYIIILTFNKLQFVDSKSLKAIQINKENKHGHTRKRKEMKIQGKSVCLEETSLVVVRVERMLRPGHNNLLKR